MLKTPSTFFIHIGSALPISSNEAALSHNDKLSYLDEIYSGTLNYAKR